MAEATDGGIVVSRTVNDLAFGSNIEFTGPGERELFGVPGSWALFASGGRQPTATRVRRSVPEGTPRRRGMTPARPRAWLVPGKRTYVGVCLVVGGVRL